MAKARVEPNSPFRRGVAKARVEPNWHVFTEGIPNSFCGYEFDLKKLRIFLFVRERLGGIQIRVSGNPIAITDLFSQSLHSISPQLDSSLSGGCDSNRTLT